MNKRVVRCASVMTAMCLIVLRIPSSPSHPNDSFPTGPTPSIIESNPATMYEITTFDGQDSAKRESTRQIRHFSLDCYSDISLSADEVQDDEFTKIQSQIYGTIGHISTDDFEILCKVLYAEAGNQPAEGKRRVIDVILNRVAHPAFEDTIEGVVFEEGQFTCVSNGSFAKADPDIPEEDKRLIEEELLEQADYEIVFFNRDHYSAYGVPAYQIADHYFSTWN